MRALRKFKIDHGHVAPPAIGACSGIAGRHPAPHGTAVNPASLKILHILRAPLGGLFRHVFDVAQGQAARGHRVGLILDSTTGGTRAKRRSPSSRRTSRSGSSAWPSLANSIRRDISALRRLAPDHTHNPMSCTAMAPKGGAGAPVPNARRQCAPTRRMAARWSTVPAQLAAAFIAPSKASQFSHRSFSVRKRYTADLFRNEIGPPRAMVRIVRNGVGKAEFEPVAARPDATDIVCVGELRPVKAIDVLIEALAILKRPSADASPRPLSAKGRRDANSKPRPSVSASPIRSASSDRPAREAFAMGRMLVISSRAESLPYIVLEAAAAGVPIVSTGVGGMPEIFGPKPGTSFRRTTSPGWSRPSARRFPNPPKAARGPGGQDAGAERILAGDDGGRRPRRLSRGLAMRKLAQFE